MNARSLVDRELKHVRARVMTADIEVVARAGEVAPVNLCHDQSGSAIKRLCQDFAHWIDDHASATDQR